MSDAPQTLTVVIPLNVKRRGGRKAMLTPGGMALPGLLKGVPVDWATQCAAMSSEPAGRNWEVRGIVANA